jgi:hypothetical protein
VCDALLIPANAGGGIIIDDAKDFKESAKHIALGSRMRARPESFHSKRFVTSYTSRISPKTLE